MFGTALFGLFSAGSGVVMWLIPAIFALYIVARWRAKDENDPQLGWKTALCVFLWLGFQAMCAGLALLIFGGIEDKSFALRTGFAVLVGGALVFAVHVPFLRRTNANTHPVVPRMFSGLNLLMVGLAATAALWTVLVMYFQEGDGSGSAQTAALSALLVYGVAWACTGWIHHDRFIGSPPPSQPVDNDESREPEVFAAPLP